MSKLSCSWGQKHQILTGFIYSALLRTEKVYLMRTAQKAKSVSWRENNTHTNTVLLGKATSLRMLWGVGVGGYPHGHQEGVCSGFCEGQIPIRCHEMSFRPLPSSPLPMVETDRQGHWGKWKGGSSEGYAVFPMASSCTPPRALLTWWSTAETALQPSKSSLPSDLTTERGKLATYRDYDQMFHTNSHHL